VAYLVDAGRRWRVADEDGRALIGWSVGAWMIVLIHAAAEPMLTYPDMIMLMWIGMLLPALVALPRDRPPQRRPAGRRRDGNGIISTSSRSKVPSASSSPP